MKSYILTVEERRGYLHIKVTGECTEENVEGYIRDFLRTCGERGCSAALIEEDLKGCSLETLTIFKIVSERSAEARSQMRRLAYVDLNPEHDVDRLRFAETVAVNRGVNFRLFPTVAEAERWLLQETAEVVQNG